MHKRYDIHPDDFIAVGAEEVVGSIAFAERYGCPVTDKEREAVNLYYSRQTRAFGSAAPLPSSYAGTRSFFERYMDEQVRYDPLNERLCAVLTGFLGTLAPAWIRPLFVRVLLAQLDPRVARACGIKPASRPMRGLAHVVLRGMGRKDPVPDGAPNPLEGLIRRIYPDGYNVHRLGTHLPDAG